MVASTSFAFTSLHPLTPVNIPTIGPALPSHLAAILSTCLAISSQPDDHRAPAAEESALRVSQAAGDENLQPLVEELLRALEDAGASGRALGAAGLVAGYCKTANGAKREALQEHVDALLTVSCRTVMHVWACVCFLLAFLPLFET